MNSSTFAPSSAGTDQQIPHPAEIARGTGISLPGMSLFLQALSKAMASVVELKVNTFLNVFSSILSCYGLITFVAFAIVSTIVYMFVTEPTASFSLRL